MSWEIETYHVKVQLIEELLGTVPCNPSIWADHIAAKQAKALKKEGYSEEEIQKEIQATIAGVQNNDEMESGKTTFFQDDKGYFLRDYQIKGFLKESAKVLKQYGPTKQLRSKVVQTVFVRPRKIYVADSDAELEVIERPLRGQTPQGERVAIARSLAVPAETNLEFDVQCLNGTITKGCLDTLLEYGQFAGIGQWRGAGKGSFAVLQMEAK